MPKNTDELTSEKERAHVLNTQVSSSGSEETNRSSQKGGQKGQRQEVYSNT